MPNSCNYQVSDLADSLSLTSEPPDIRNWFSSYAYESPELNTYENCEDSALIVSDSEEEAVDDCERRVQNKQEEENIEGTTRNKGKLVPDEVDSYRSTKCTNTAQNCDYTEASEVLGSLPNSLALSPEPPHVGRWFSSYAYESPLLDTTIDFSGSESQCVESNGAKGYDEKFCNEKEGNLGNPKSVSEINMLPTAEKVFTYNLATCNNSMDVANSQLRCSDKVIHTVTENRSDLIDLPNKKTHEHIWRAKPTQDQNVASKHISKRDIDSEDFISREPMNNTSSSKSNKSLHKSTHTRNLANLASESADKENCVSENGFVSTKKKISGIKGGASSLKRSVEVPLVINREYIPKRKPFTEMTNSQHNDGLDITGKWKCPQKRKPNLGPPLKQLRLEQWVNRM